MPTRSRGALARIHATASLKLTHERLRSFLASLRYGAIGVNIPSVMVRNAGGDAEEKAASVEFTTARDASTQVYLTSGLSWGAFPGHTPDDIGSGTGVVSNTHLYSDVQKSVLRAPWRRPAGAGGPEFSRALVAFMRAPSVLNAARLGVHALRG
jgi:aldehyde dehydrogenase (NAD(P)+)